MQVEILKQVPQKYSNTVNVLTVAVVEVLIQMPTVSVILSYSVLLDYYY